MKQYQSIKKVRAFKVVAVGTLSDGFYLISADPQDNVDVSVEWMDKRVPAEASCVGGYFVQYEDGYSSWSPAATFESGYTPIA